jgi:hypothetical protein
MADVSALQLEQLYYPAGELIINWSVLDYQLVLIVAALYQNDRGKSLEDQLPREFGRRVRFLRKCISRFPQLQPFATDMRNMLTAAKELVIVRDTLVHGAVSGYDERDKYYSFKRPDIDKNDDMHQINTIRMTLDDIRDYVAQSQTLMTFAIQIAEHLVDSLP